MSVNMHDLQPLDLLSAVVSGAAVATVEIVMEGQNRTVIQAVSRRVSRKVVEATRGCVEEEPGATDFAPTVLLARLLTRPAPDYYLLTGPNVPDGPEDTPVVHSLEEGEATIGEFMTPPDEEDGIEDLLAETWEGPYERAAYGLTPVWVGHPGPSDADPVVEALELLEGYVRVERESHSAPDGSIPDIDDAWRIVAAEERLEAAYEYVATDETPRNAKGGNDVS